MALMWAATIAKRRRKLAAQLRERHAGRFGNLGKTDLLDRLLGKKREEGRDDFVAVAGRRRGLSCGGWCARGLAGGFAGGFAGHDRTPDS